MEKAETISFNDLYIQDEHIDNQRTFDPLWHYTNISGLIGIIRESLDEKEKLHFWFTESNCLNDISEGNHILDMYKMVCKECLEKQQISKEFFDAVYDMEIPNHMFIYYPIPTDKNNSVRGVIDCKPCHAYICSFSLKEDSLDMWRYYSKGEGGYGIKIDPFIFDDYLDYETDEYDENRTFSLIRSFAVIYDNLEKKKILEEMVLKIFNAYQNSPIGQEEKKIKSCQYISYKLKKLQFQFKHECYATENEYRFVYYLPYNKPERLKNELPEIKYRKQNGMVVPYIDIVVKNASEHLEEVLISPFIANETVLSTTSEYLTKCGFNTNVRLSQLPVRK